MPSEPKDYFTLPAITCTSENQGISCFVPRENATIFKNKISVAANGDATAFYQPHEFTILQDAYVLAFKNQSELSEECYLYLTARLQKALLKFSWSNKSGWEKVKNESITLPTQNHEIAFEFMESYIKELEFERIKELEAYLRVCGLENYELNSEEKAALNAFANGEFEFREFRIGEIFEIISTKSLDEGKLTFIENGINFVGRVNENNGVKGKIQKQNFEPNQANTITATVIGNYKYAKLQREPYYCSQNINKLTPKFSFDKHRMYFFVAHIQKFISTYNNQQGGYVMSELKNHIIKLPIDKNHEIAFEFMENFIKAIEKEVIKSVVLYTQSKLNAAKSVVMKS